MTSTHTAPVNVQTAVNITIKILSILDSFTTIYKSYNLSTLIPLKGISGLVIKNMSKAFTLYFLSKKDVYHWQNANHSLYNTVTYYTQLGRSWTLMQKLYCKFYEAIKFLTLINIYPYAKRQFNCNFQKKDHHLHHDYTIPQMLKIFLTYNILYKHKFSTQTIFHHSLTQKKLKAMGRNIYNYTHT